MTSLIFQKNSIRKKRSGVWCHEGEEYFDYTDSNKAEENIKQIIMNSLDRTSMSVELEEKIFDWASEYHLSSQRANLFRFLELNKIENMLELGCGCGANTRFLGESGIKVDAVEGSYRRAEISRIRCEGLENVNVINANFNHLQYPEKSYDSVSLMGVLEYALKYKNDSNGSKDAVVDILLKTKTTLRENGLLFISIENRMGLKYWLGASEDHLGKPYSGIYDYPGNSGIRTYTRNEWMEILAAAGFNFYRFCYPFPDYKSPRIILSDMFFENDPYAYSLLYRIVSRDYGKVWHPESNEFLIWRALCRTGDIEYFSNSFFIIASASHEYLNSIIPYDFMQFPDSGRKVNYRTITFKPQGVPHVFKKKINNIEKDEDDSFLVQTISKQSEYKKGRLLSSIWLLSIETESKKNSLEKLIRNYYSFIINNIDQSKTECNHLDLLPSNIIVDDQGSFNIIDQEWIVREKIEPEFILFRALFWFGVHNKYVLSKYTEALYINTVKDFIKYAFDTVNASTENIEYFLLLEEKIHTEITREIEPGKMKKMLSEPLRYEDNKVLFQNEELVAKKDKEILQKNNEIQKRNREIHKRDRKIQKITFELEAIENSKVWRLAVYLRILFYEKLLGHFPLMQKGAFYLSNEGVRPFIVKTAQFILRKFRSLSFGLVESSYERWIKNNEVVDYDTQQIKEDIAEMKLTPMISIIMPVYDVDIRWLEKAIQSVKCQLYDNWELCIADDASTQGQIQVLLRKYEDEDSRIKIKYLEHNQGISGASNKALSIATGEYIALLDHDDELSKDALYEVVKFINKYPDAEMIYSDEDMIDEKGIRMNPYFKPAWSPDTLLSGNYITHLSVYQKKTVDEIGGFRKGYEGSQDFDLALRFTEKTNKIYHIPKILYHWRKIEGSVAASTDAKNYAYDNAKKALEDTLVRRNIKGEVEFGYGTGYYVVKRNIDTSQLVSIVIISGKSKNSLQRCLESVETKTEIKNYEIIIPATEEDNDINSLANHYNNCRIIVSDHKLNPSAACNYAAKFANGQHLVFLHGGMEVTSDFWLRSMLEQSQRPEIGAVGAKLLYPDKTIQHAGIILGIHGVAGNAYKKSNDFTEHYFGHLNIIKNYSAVSNSCMMLKTDLFREIGGFDEINLPFFYSDVDLCLRLSDKGFNNIYTPFSVLYHHNPDTDIDYSEKDDRYYMLEKWGDRLKKDPYYNPNLTFAREDFSIRI